MSMKPSSTIEAYRRTHPQRGPSPAGASWGFFEVPIGYGGRPQYLLRIIASDGDGWDHVSVSRSDRRFPTWSDMCWVKAQFWDAEDTVIQFHPAASQYVNIHVGCLHLWKKQGVTYELPPKEMV